MNVPSINTFGQARQLIQSLADGISSLQRWRWIDPRAFVPLPASTSRITCNSTAWAVAGLPIRWMQNGTVYYGLVEIVSPNAYIQIAGAPLVAGTPIQMLWVGRPELVETREFFGAGAYGDTGFWYTKFKPNRRYWGHGRAHVVRFTYIHETSASTSQPQINIAITTTAGATRYVLTANGGNGVTPSTAWAASGVDIDPATYYVDFTNRVTLEVKVADTGATRAQDFSGLVTFVLE